MIAHFLARDFHDNVVAWVLLSVPTALGALTAWAGPAGFALPFLAWIYFMFAMFLSGQTVGSVWRTQHQLSRYYLLALPLAHRRLFAIQQVRMLVAWLPLLGLAGLLPWLGVVPSAGTVLGCLGYYAALGVSAGLLIQVGLWTTLEQERIAAYLPKGARFWAHAKGFVVSALVWAFLWVAWMQLLDPSSRLPYSLSRHDLPIAEVVFPAGAIVLAIWLRHNARRWCVTL
jgi:hypothetical protein